MNDALALFPEQASATIDGDYRYRLDRWWGDGPRLVWVMLNPSTADHREDDPTIRRVRGFTQREGYDGFTVVNLYSLRATDPAALTSHDDPVGWHGDLIQHAVIVRAPAVVVAWGAHPMAEQRARQFRASTPDALCLGHTKSGAPRHPLYVRKDQPLVPAWPAVTGPYDRDGGEG